MSESEQNLAGQQIHEGKLRRYLLGQCPANESAEIERAAFQDSSVSDALSVIEDELTEDYVCDQLNDLDRSCFELKFLTSSERREKLRLSALLLNRTEVLRRVPPDFVRAHQLTSEEMKDALRATMEGASGLVTGGGRESTPVNTTSPVLNPTPSIVSVTLRWPTLGAYEHPESRESAVFIVKGQNFTEGTTVQWNGLSRKTQFVDSTTLLAICPKSDLAIANAATIRIVVVNPPPGGGPSPPFILSPTPEK